MGIIAVIAVLAFCWWLVKHAWRGGDDHDDAASLARRHIKNGWRPLTRKDQ